MARRGLSPLLAAAGLCLACTATDAAPPRAPAEQASETAIELARVSYPADNYLQIMEEGWELEARALAARSAVLSALELKHPGVSEAALAAARPLSGAAMRDMVEVMIVANARIYARHMNEAAMRDAISFYRTALGQKALLAAVAPGSGASERAEAAAIAETIRGLTDAEKAELVRLLALPSMKKLATAREEARRLMDAGAYMPNAAALQPAAAAMKDAIQQFIARSPR